MSQVSSLRVFEELSAPELPAETWGDWFFTQIGTGLDQVALEAMRRVVDAALMPPPEALPALRASARPFVSGDLWTDPRRFFDFLDAPADALVPRTRYRRDLAGGRLVGRVFAGRYRPYVASVPSDPQADRILVEHWMHEGTRPRGTVLALHGFSMGRPRIDAIALMASQWYERGLDVALLTLPYHGARTPSGTRFSGERFAVPNAAEMNEAVRRAVYEIYSLRAWLREQTGAPVGLLGLSLGGYLSALMAGLVDDLDFVIPMVPPVCIGELAWRFFSRSRHYDGPDGAAFSRDELRANYRVHSPLTYPRRVAKKRLLIIAGRGDRIVPPEHPHALWQHWGEPSIHWFGGSHLAPFGRDRIIAAIEDHLAGLRIL